jgi:hypothetical protein
MRWEKILQLHALGAAIQRSRRANTFTVLYGRGAPIGLPP